ncbi:MAG: hypothetical protein R3F34_13275 [Planctomycetota bacterium]
MKSLNFTRWVILISFLASAVMGWFVYDSNQRLADLEGQTSRAPHLVKGVIAKAHELQSLRKIASTRQDLDNLTSYITGRASGDGVQIGNVEITSGKQDYSSAFVDEIYTIKPARVEKRPEYPRTKIANFAFMIERGTSVRVTKIRIFPPSHLPRIRPNEVGPDIWTFELEARQRKRK